jgi:hypothetical protein
MIDHYKLIDLLSERLKTDIKSVGADLLTVLEDLHRTLKEQGHSEIPGLGTFRLVGNTIEFEADTQLLIDINFRYHGFNEIVLESASELEGQSVSYDETIPESAIFVIDERETIVSHDEPEYDESAEVGPSLADTFIADIPSESVISSISKESDSKDVGESDSNISSDKQRELATEQAPEALEVEVDALHTPIQIKIRDGYTRSYDHAKHRLAAAFFIISILGGALYAWYDGWLDNMGVPSFASTFPGFANTNDSNLITTSSPIIEIVIPPANLSAVNDSTLVDSTGVVLEQDSSALVQNAEATNSDNSYGLMGQYDTTIADFHTIVSGTFFTERIATQALDSALTLGWRARLNRVRVSGSPAWELHIGQFQTREDGREANRSIDRMFQSEVVRRYEQQ